MGRLLKIMRISTFFTHSIYLSRSSFDKINHLIHLCGYLNLHKPKQCPLINNQQHRHFKWYYIFWAKCIVVHTLHTTTDSGQKYSDASIFPYILHINLQGKKNLFWSQFMSDFDNFLIDTSKIESSQHCFMRQTFWENTS